MDFANSYSAIHRSGDEIAAEIMTVSFLFMNLASFPLKLERSKKCSDSP